MALEQPGDTVAERAAAPQRPSIDFREVEGQEDWRQIEALREAIYVSAENRIGEETGFYGSFDRYNDYSKWFIAMSEGRALGCAKIIRESELGLPYESIIGRQERKPGQVIAEIGHLLSMSGPTSAPVVLGLMRVAFAYCVNELGATHVVGDVFMDKSKGDAFYHRLGFTRLHGPYRDPRFVNAPLSMIVILETASIVPLMRSSKGTRKDLLRYLTGACNDADMQRAAAE